MAPVSRQITRYIATVGVQLTSIDGGVFPERFTRTDIELEATVDEAHETLSGPATQRITYRFILYGREWCWR